MRFKTIDGLRGIAALAVVVFHLNEATHVAFGEWLPSAVDWIFRQGHYGVDIFFVISGFVIAYSIRSAAPTLPFAGRFALRRSARLDPPYWSAIFLEISVQALALRMAFSEAPLPSTEKIFAHFFYLQNLLGYGDIIDIFWTLCFEIQFYLALIALFVFRRKLDQWLGRPTTEWLAATALSILFIYSVFIRFEVFGLVGHPGVATIRWYQFFMGTCVWWVVSERVTWHVLPAMWLLLAAVILSTSSSALELLPIAISALLWWSYRKDKMLTVFSGRTLLFLGGISYSLYVFHATIGWRLIRLIGVLMGDSAPHYVPYIAFLLSVAVCIFTAWVAWRVLEGPSMRLSKQIELPKVAT